MVQVEFVVTPILFTCFLSGIDGILYTSNSDKQIYIFQQSDCKICSVNSIFFLYLRAKNLEFKEMKKYIAFDMVFIQVMQVHVTHQNM